MLVTTALFFAVSHGPTSICAGARALTGAFPRRFRPSRTAKVGPFRAGSGAGNPLGARVYRLAVVILYTAGLRRGELLRLRIGDYDPSRRTLLVRRSKFRKSRVAAL